MLVDTLIITSRILSRQPHLYAEEIDPRIFDAFLDVAHDVGVQTILQVIRTVSNEEN